MLFTNLRIKESDLSNVKCFSSSTKTWQSHRVSVGAQNCIFCPCLCVLSHSHCHKLGLNSHSWARPRNMQPVLVFWGICFPNGSCNVFRLYNFTYAIYTSIIFYIYWSLLHYTHMFFKGCSVLGSLAFWKAAIFAMIFDRLSSWATVESAASRPIEKSIRFSMATMYKAYIRPM